MAVFTQTGVFVKQHWKVIGGSVAGVFLLYFIYKHSKHPSAQSAVDLSSSNALGALNAAQQLQDAQVNGATTIAQLQSAVASRAVDAQVTSSVAQTSAQREVSLAQTAAQLQATLHGQDTALAIQKLQADADVSKYQIEGSVYDKLIAAKVSVSNAQTAADLKVFSTLAQYSKHFSQDIKAVVPFIAATHGAPAAGAQAVASISNANAAKTASIVSSVSGVASSLLSGLFL